MKACVAGPLAIVGALLLAGCGGLSDVGEQEKAKTPPDAVITVIGHPSTTSNGKVIVHDVIHGGTTVLLPNDNFTLAYFDYDENFERFIGPAEQAVAAVLSGDGAFRPNPGDDRIHFTALPWVSFTSFSHARNWRTEDSVPKVAFGKFVKTDERTLLPFSVEVHHALMDGVHVGRFVTRLEEALQHPETYLNT